MPSGHSQQSIVRLLRTILSFLSTEWLTILPDLLHAAQRWWGLKHPQGMYEILDYDSTLELCDPAGKVAIFKKRQRVKFLQDHILAFPDLAWGDGDIFAEYKCTPGKVVDVYQEGDRWNILISLRESKQAGDITDFYIERTVKNGFTEAEEYRQLEIRHPTRRIRISIIFPTARRCQRAVLIERGRRQSRVLGPEHFADLPDGRQQLSWEARRIRRFEVYAIKWCW